VERIVHEADAARFCPNLSLLWAERPLPERFAAAEAAGFTAVELWWPGVQAAKQLAGLCAEHGLTVHALNVPAGDMAAGERGFANDPARTAEFRAGVDAAAHAAKGTGCRHFNALLGLELEGVDRAVQLACARENLAWAADRLADATILVEPVNVLDNGPYLVPGTDAVVELVRATERANVRLLADVYHMVRSCEDPVAMLVDHRDVLGHVQIADAPGRGEPGTGAIDLRAVFATLVQIAYDGRIGLEYRPSGTDAAASLGWLA
jgi:hydroxypyruvate isomerase